MSNLETLLKKVQTITEQIKKLNKIEVDPGVLAVGPERDPEDPPIITDPDPDPEDIEASVESALRINISILDALLKAQDQAGDTVEISVKDLEEIGLNSINVLNNLTKK